MKNSSVFLPNYDASYHILKHLIGTRVCCVELQLSEDLGRILLTKTLPISLNKEIPT